LIPSICKDHFPCYHAQTKLGFTEIPVALRVERRKRKDNLITSIYCQG
jgi:hypothetical protein